MALLKEFQTYLQDERHFSPYTARCYGADLRQFSEWISEDTGPLGGLFLASGIDAALCAVEASDLNRFVSFLADGVRNYSAATISRKVATLRSFYKWLKVSERRSTNPAENLRASGGNHDSTGTWVPSRTLTRRILDSIDDNDVFSMRDRALLECLVSLGGAKTSTLLALNRDAFTRRGLMLSLPGKGGMLQAIALSDSAGMALASALTAWDQEFGAPEGEEPTPLFANKHRSRLSSRSVRRRLDLHLGRFVLENADIDEETGAKIKALCPRSFSLLGAFTGLADGDSIEDVCSRRQISPAHARRLASHSGQMLGTEGASTLVSLASCA